MSDTSSIKTSSTPPSYSQCVKESKLTNAVLITGFVALLILGILASSGAFESMGTANAAYFSYGMYGGATLFLIATVVKIALNYKKGHINKGDDRTVDQKTPENEREKFKQFVEKHIEMIAIADSCTKKDSHCTHPCYINFKNSVIAAHLTSGEIGVILRALPPPMAFNPPKCVLQINFSKNSEISPHNLEGLMAHLGDQKVAETAEQILRRLNPEIN